MPERRVFVTGATGFIGAPLVRQALERGWEVVALLVPGDDGSRLGDALGRVHIVRGTLACSSDWGAEVARLAPTACVHLAWNTLPSEYLDTVENVDWLHWSARLVSELQGWGCRHVVGVGTCAEYAAADRRLDESAPTGPSTLYAACKAGLRLVGRALATRDDMRFAWARVFHLFGPHEHEERLVPACIRALLSGRRFPATAGSQVRDFLHVDDVAAGLLCILESQVEGDVNVCSGEPVPVRTLLETVERATGASGALDIGALSSRAWDPPFLVGDASRLRSLGWMPRHSLEGGIAATVAWWRERR